MKILEITKSKELNEFAALLAANGYDIISYYPGTDIYGYFNFHKDGYFGYCQIERFEGFSLSTVNKPCRKYGTGHRYAQGWDILTLDKAKSTLNFSKQLITGRRSNEIKNYSSVKEFLEKSFGSKKKIINYDKSKHKSK